MVSVVKYMIIMIVFFWRRIYCGCKIVLIGLNKDWRGMWIFVFFEIGDKWNVLVVCLFVFVYCFVDLLWVGDVYVIDVILRVKYVILIIFVFGIRGIVLFFF